MGWLIAGGNKNLIMADTIRIVEYIRRISENEIRKSVRRKTYGSNGPVDPCPVREGGWL